MRATFFQFLEKQDTVATPGQVVLDNRSMLKEIISSADFDEKKARSFVEKVTAVIQDATINRLQLRHDLYQQLTPEQQKQYLEIVQSSVAGMLN
jgi:Spy/CpxP family protein refolding chaperone